MRDPRSHAQADAPFVIALDGPAASGKSTVGMGVARELGFFYFDTGVLYRGLTWVALQRGVDVTDGEALARLATSVRLDARPPSRDDGRQLDLLADGEDITHAIRRPEVDRHVSVVAAHPGVRAALVEPQRAQVRPPGTILAGRDIGTVIAPDAALKVWLSASAEERARRRSLQTGEPLESVLAAMTARDRLDGAREAAPMAKAADAVEIDCDRLSAHEVIEHIVALARERMSAEATGRGAGA